MIENMIERSDLIKPGLFAVIAGPCAIESAEQIYNIAIKLSTMGIGGLRAMHEKYRTRQESFQGLGPEILGAIEEIKRKTGMIIVGEIMEKEDLKLTKNVFDVVQIGSRSMYNTRLLKACREDGRPVLFKRAMEATVEEWVELAKYVGLDKVIMCERGIRSAIDGEGRKTRFTLDLGGAWVVKNEYDLPVIGDPSHSAGRRDLVPALARSIAAVGLDGMEIEVHENPDQALCDAKQQITPKTLSKLLKEIRAIRGIVVQRQLCNVV